MNGENPKIGLGPVTDRLAGNVVQWLQGDEFKKNAEKFIEPISQIIQRRVRPYMYIAAGMYFVTVVMLIIIIVMLARKSKV